VGIPSFAKFNIDILFLFTVLGNFAELFPKVDLPLPDLNISNMMPSFSLLDISIDIPGMYIPEWMLGTNFGSLVAK